MIDPVLVIALIPLILAGLWLWQRPNWMGLSGKTLWDWIALLAVPGTVTLAAIVLASVQFRIEQAQRMESALAGYVDRITRLMLDPDLQIRPDLARALGRAHTQAIFGTLDGERAGRVLAFLTQVDALQDFAPSLEGRDLRGSMLKGLDLSGMDFEDADLSGADIEGARLFGADLEGSDLREADLKTADLRNVDFDETRLDGADLAGADLRGADLSTATGLSQRQVDRACTDAATRLPQRLSLPRDPRCDMDPEAADDD